MFYVLITAMPSRIFGLRKSTNIDGLKCYRFSLLTVFNNNDYENLP